MLVTKSWGSITIRAGLLFLSLLLIAFVPLANAYDSDTICLSWSKKSHIPQNSKATWTGEGLEVRFYYDSELKGQLRLHYKIEGSEYKSMAEAGGSLFGGFDSNSWNTVYFELPYMPDRWYISFLEDVCLESREKTLWEKLKEM